METIKIKRLNKWANAHSYYPIDILRIALGIFLILKGVHFIGNSQELIDLMSPLSNFTGGMFFFHYVASAHIMGGMMIAFGLLTRWAIWAQLPIIIGAVAINFMDDFVVSNFLMSVLVLALCIGFLIFGGGKHSADYYFKMEK